MKQIIVTIDKKGGSKIEAFGFQGGECLAATKSIEDALGKLVSRKMKTSVETVTETATVTQ
jgi:hypothetical protein